MRNRPSFLCVLACLFVLYSLARAENVPAHRPTFESEGENGNFLVLPGIGKIPLPPGVRAFGPGNGGQGAAPSLAPLQQGPQSVEPAQPARSADERRAAELNQLYARLAVAQDEQEARSVATNIMRRWSTSGSDTIDLLLARAAAAEQAGTKPLARTLLDYVIALSPFWPEAFVRRAHLRAEDDVAGALDDLETAARLEPRRFDAFAALGALAEKSGDKKKALDAYRKALAISPRQDALRKDEERVKFDLEGRDI